MPKTGIITIPLHIGDFLGGTMHMDTLEKGAYIMLLLSHYQIGIEGLPNDNKKLARIAGVTLKVWDRICPILREKFTVTDHFWEHKKVIEVIRKVEHVSSQNSAKALKRFNSDNATAEPLICQPKPKPKPIEKDNTYVLSKKNKKLEKPDDVSQSVWDDFITHRKSKKATVTETVLKSIRSESEKIGWTVEKAMAEMCARGWQGFKAQWIINEQKGNQNVQSSSRNLTKSERADIALGITKQESRGFMDGPVEASSAPIFRYIPDLR